MTKNVDFASAIKNHPTVVPTESVVEPSKAVVKAQKDERSSRPPSRRGTKHVGAHFDPAVTRQLREIAAKKDTSIQSLLGQALNMLFHAEGMPTIAREESYEKGRG